MILIAMITVINNIQFQYQCCVTFSFQSVAPSSWRGRYKLEVGCPIL